MLESPGVAVKVYQRPLSHSSMSMYLECPQKFKFRYIDKLPEQPKWFFSFGQSVHAALEFLYSIPALPPPTLAQLLEHYKKNWKKDGYKNAEQEREHLAEGEKILTDFYKLHIKDFRLPLFAEYKFEFEVEGVPLLGFVDRIDRLDNGNLSVIDYKTGKAIKQERLHEDRQLTLYQMAVERLLGAKVERLTFYHLPSQKPLTVGPRAQQQLDALAETIVSVNEGIQAERFDPTPSEKVCQWCDFRPHCPVFKSMYAAPAPMPPGFGFGSRAAEDPSVPALVAAGSEQDRIAALVDEYGDLLGKAAEAQAAADAVREELAAVLTKKGYVRAFGNRYELSLTPESKWEFKDKNKILEVLKRHGLYDCVLKPSAPEVYKLLDSPEFPAEARKNVEKFGERKEQPRLSVKPLRSA